MVEVIGVLCAVADAGHPRHDPVDKDVVARGIAMRQNQFLRLCRQGAARVIAARIA